MTDQASFLSAGKANVEIGGWLSAEKDFGLIVAFDRDVDLEPIPLVSDDRVFTLQGRARPEVVDRLEAIGAKVSFGPFSTTTCNADPTVAFPDFSIQCAARDQTTFVSLSAGLKASRRIGTGLMSAARFRTAPGVQYSPPPVPTPEPKRNSEFVPALLAAINQIRAQAGLEPMSLSSPQSEVVGKLRPRIDVALGERNYKLGDRLVAGMSAGWEIDADIVGGNWTLRRVRRTHIADVLTYMWQSANRKILFGEAARFAAIHWDESGRLTLATYNTIPEEHYNRRVARVFRRINELRAAYGRPKVRRLARLNSEIKEVCDKVTAGKLTVDQGFERLGGVGMQVGGTWRNYDSVSDLSDVSISPRIINRRNLEVGVGVAITREPGSPFAHYVVYFIWPG